jgi:hypothetical protein
MLRKIKNQQMTVLIVLLLFTVLGTVLLTKSHAATPYASVDASSGTLDGVASLKTDSATNSGTAVLFGISSSSSSSKGFQEGDYEGYSNVPGIAKFSSETGTKVALAGEYLDGTSWQSIDAGINSAWTNSGYQMAIGVDMLPNSGASLADGAAGDYNSYYDTLAKNLVAQGAGNAILHIGWEWDQGNPWAVANSTDASNFAAFWRQIVTTMRSVPGTNFNYAWYYGDGEDGTDITAEAYPGSSYVSSIDLDFYDQSWDGSCGLAYNGSAASSTQSQCIWNDDLVKELNNFSSFAASNNEPMGFGEWGVIDRSDGHGLGDDPTFIINFTNWVNTHDVEYTDYFDYNSGGNSVLSSFPNSLAQYKKSMLNLKSTY